MILEPARQTRVLGEYDVLVAGGGIAGVSAALAAARAGASVCLLEKACALGGLATIGHVVVFLPLCDGLGHQISGGICEELIRLSADDLSQPDSNMGQIPIPEAWQQRKGSIEQRSKSRYRCSYNPITFAYKMERLLLKHKVKLLFDTRVVAVRREAERIAEVIIENKSGRSALSCKAVVDASGDADICALAGEKTVSLKSNVRCGWYYMAEGGIPKLIHLTQPFDSQGRRIPSSGRNYRGDDGDEVSKFLLDCRLMTMQDLQERERKSGLHSYPLALPLIPCFRMTRRLVGRKTLRQQDRQRWLENALGMCSDWRKVGPVYCLPLEALIGVHNANLITAGRCISSAGDTWDITRSIPVCAVTGEAAGAAAANLALDKLPGFRELDVPALQKYLRRKKVIIDKKLLENF
ncbi:MAG: FAD-dependent oxidoreductase [Oligosphaeraceae bacterium]|nr:FAD-dependent oxidoreductase [Oligosphaeraceae bacterium]